MNYIDLLDSLSEVQAIVILYSDAIIRKYGNLSKIRATLNNVGDLASEIKESILKEIVLKGDINTLIGTPYEYFTYEILFSRDFADYDYDFVLKYILPRFHPNINDAMNVLERVGALFSNSRMTDALIFSKRVDQLLSMLEKL